MISSRTWLQPIPTFHDSSIGTLAWTEGPTAVSDPSTVRVANDISPACRHSIPRATTQPSWHVLADIFNTSNNIQVHHGARVGV